MNCKKIIKPEWIPEAYKEPGKVGDAIKPVRERVTEIIPFYKRAKDLSPYKKRRSN